MQVRELVRYNRDMDTVTVNHDPIRIRYIVCSTPDPSADEEQDFVPPQEAERACSEVRSAVNRWLYADRG